MPNKDLTREWTKEELAAFEAIVPLPPIEGQDKWVNKTPASESDNFLKNLRAAKPDPQPKKKIVSKEMVEVVGEVWHPYGNPYAKGQRRGSGGGGGDDHSKQLISDKELGQIVEDWHKGSVFGEAEYKEKGGYVLARVYEKLGYNAKPKEVGPIGFEKLSAKDNIFVYRGITEKPTLATNAPKTQAERYPRAQQFINGNTHYAGSGVSGNGTYTAQALSTARNYNNHEGGVIRIAIPKKAKLADGDALIKKADAEYKKSYDKLVANYNFNRNKITSDANLDAAEKYKKSDALENKYLADIRLIREKNDPGVYAAIHGYDGIAYPKEDNRGIYIILNRGAIIVDRKLYKEIV